MHFCDNFIFDKILTVFDSFVCLYCFWFLTVFCHIFEIAGPTLNLSTKRDLEWREKHK